MNRLARLDSASSWAGDLNPVQRAALEYLRDANRFSRSPSHVAEFLGTTRGTMSQTLKALLRKGYVEEVRSDSDKRSISYALSNAGQAVLGDDGVVAVALAKLTGPAADALESGLRETLRQALALNGAKTFGQCRSCRFHQTKGDTAFCQLLSLPLAPSETMQICVEHQDRQTA